MTDDTLLTRQQLNQRRIDKLNVIEKLQELEDPTESDEYCEPLSIDTKIEKIILLSYGGPADGFKLYFNQEKELLGGIYFYQDWGTNQETELTDDEAQMVYDFYMGGYFE